MVGMFGQKVSLGQANGPDVELVVQGSEFYSTYKTPEGFSVVYDEALGLFCYARLVDGQFQSTGIPVTKPPPPDVEQHAAESVEVRMRKSQERMQKMDHRSTITSKQGE